MTAPTLTKDVGGVTDRPVVEVSDVVVTFRTKAGHVQAVSGVSFDIAEGEALGVVGESGCGKSTLARAILQLPRPNSGSVRFLGQELTEMSSGRMRRVRPQLQMVFQDPISSLNPRRTVRQLVAEPMAIWRTADKRERGRKADEMLEAVGLDPALFGDRRPGQLSGGQCQRVAIARALVAGAKLLVCDEPVSSLDVSLRATVLNLLEDLRERFDLSILFIAHDLAVVRNISDRVMVMYLGKVVELAESEALYREPAHPYTRALLDSIPQPDPLADPPRMNLSGDLPSPVDPPSGCRLRTRCPLARQICTDVEPPLREVSPGHLAACHFAGQLESAEPATDSPVAG